MTEKEILEQMTKNNTEAIRFLQAVTGQLTVNQINQLCQILSPQDDKKPTK